ncbi:MAG: hypothetical protein MJZ03_02635 [archaeon]|nr:hypothetical protein [archaeon]
MAVVVVHMKFCNKIHKITVKQKEDGDFYLHIASNCPEVKEYRKLLGDTLTMNDLTDIRSSKIFSYDNCERVTMTCLVPNGVINAAWLEAGMLSKSRAKEIGENTVSFEKVK